MAKDTIRWAAELHHVREVSLLGTADLDFWRERLAAEGLAPLERDGKAQLMIVAAEGTFMRVRFRELSFSVLACDPGASDGGRWGCDGAYLVRAFNSFRFFAFCERVFFKTPYRHADVRLSTSGGASIELVDDGRSVFRAALRAGGDRQTARQADGGWEGPVYLPRTRPGGAGKLFVARLRGGTDAYPFLPDLDAITIEPDRTGDVLAALLDSHFEPDRWEIRLDATHAKSKTLSRDATCSMP